MARMLYLRDIEVDVHLRCRACGHEGVLPLAAMNRRFGPTYPVLSIAPHYRCSRCDSRDTESRPLAAETDPFDAAREADAAAEPSFAGPLAALQGLLDAARSHGGGEDDADGEAGDRGRKEPAWPEPAEEHPDVTDADHDSVPSAMDASFELEALIADGPSPSDAGRRPLWEPISLADMAARLEPADGIEDDADGHPADDGRAKADTNAGGDAEDDGDADWPVFLRRVNDQPRVAVIEDTEPEDDEPERGEPEEDAEEDGPPPIFSPRALVRTDFEDDPEEEDEERLDDGLSDEDRDEDDEPSDEEILAFAIHDPEKAPPPWERPRAPDPEEQPLDKTIAALREMVHEAAADPGSRKRKPAAIEEALPPLDVTDDSEEPDEPPPSGPVDAGPVDAEDPPAPLRKSAQEREMEEALKALQALVDDDPPEEPAPVRLPRKPARGAARDSAFDAPRASAFREETPVESEEVEAPLDLVEEVKGRDKKGKRRGKDKDAGTDSGKAPAHEPNAFDKTIAALRNMLELDGKKRR